LCAVAIRDSQTKGLAPKVDTMGEVSGGQPQQQTKAACVIGRYALYEPIASGGMATVHIGRLIGPVGFSRTVAIKRLHPQFASDPDFVSMFVDEARVAARIRHPNVVPTLDVVSTEGELFLVMDFVQGESLYRILRAAKHAGQFVKPDLACSIMIGVLHGLHAAHEAKNEQGEPLGIVHRDVSPQNVLVGTDGVPRVLDFGIAQAVGRLQTTRAGQVKGKLAYLAPEQLAGKTDRRSDVYSAAVVLWETLTRQRLFKAENDGELLHAVLAKVVEPPSRLAKGISKALDDIVMRGLAREPADRYSTAKEFATALEKVTSLISASQIGEWVETTVGSELATRAKLLAEIESSTTSSVDVASGVSGLSSWTQPSMNTPISALSVKSVNSVKSVRSSDSVMPTNRIAISGSVQVDSMPSRAKYVGLGIGAALLLVLVGLGAGKLSGGSHAPAASVVAVGAGIAPATAEKPDAAALPPPTTSSKAAPLVLDMDEPAAGSPKTGARPTTASGGTKTGGAKPVASAAPKEREKKPAGGADCSMPYSIDSQGMKHIKPECL
jgi:eukaryotic-like serine/threonine-protein kinase